MFSASPAWPNGCRPAQGGRQELTDWGVCLPSVSCLDTKDYTHHWLGREEASQYVCLMFIDLLFGWALQERARRHPWTETHRKRGAPWSATRKGSYCVTSVRTQGVRAALENGGRRHAAQHCPRGKPRNGTSAGRHVFAPGNGLRQKGRRVHFGD